MAMRIKAEYISDIKCVDFRKGIIYDNLFWPVDEKEGIYMGYTDKHGEQWALPASRFRIIEEYEVNEEE